MLKLLLLLKKSYVLLLFLLFQGIALNFYFDSTPRTRAISQGVSSEVTGFFNEKFSGVADYFSLEITNKSLLEENARLYRELARVGSHGEVSLEKIDSLAVPLWGADIEKLVSVGVIRSSYGRRDNFLTLDKGLKDGMSEDMAVFDADGIVGYTLYCSDNYTVALSILNVGAFRVGGALMSSEYSGLVSWDGIDYRMMDIVELPKYAHLKVGDTVVTRHSAIFPDNLPIGVIEDFEPSQDIFYSGRIRLFADMSSLRRVYAVKLSDHSERSELEQRVFLEGAE